MNTPHSHQSYPIQPLNQRANGRPQARRRRLLGLLLIVVGTTWLWLRLIGWVGDLPLLLGAEEAILQHSIRVSVSYPWTAPCKLNESYWVLAYMASGAATRPSVSMRLV